MGRVLGFAVAWLSAAALYMVLIDITDLPELIVAVAAALLAAAGFELAREQEIADGPVVFAGWPGCIGRF